MSQMLGISLTMRSTVGMVLALRIVAAPWVMAAPGAEMVALCSGGQIVYVSLSGAEPEGRAEVDPCPFFGITAVLEVGTAPGVEARETARTSEFTLMRTRVSADRSVSWNRSRAPPVS